MAAKKAESKTENKDNQENKIANIVKIEEVGPCKKKVNIEIPAEKIAEMFDAQYGELKRDADVPGFRRGRAPRRLLEKRFGKDVALQTKMKLLLEASESAIKDNELDVLGDPDIDHEKIEMPDEGKSLKFDFEVEVRPEFDLPSLEGVPVEKPKLSVTDDAVKNEIAELQKRAGVYKPKDGKIAAEDQVIADVKLKPEDGEEEVIDNTEIHIRQRGFVGKVPVDDLDKLLVGAKAGDVKKTTTEVPSTYYDEKYRDKKIDVEIKISDVKELVPAEMNEEFFTRFGVKTEDELTDSVRQRNEADIERQQKEAMRQSVRDYLIEKVDFELPEDVVAAQSQQLLQRQYTRLLMQGLKAEDISSQMEELKTSSQAQAVEQLKSFFVMDAVAKQLDIQATEEEINGYIAQVAMYRQMRPEQMRQQMAKDGSLSQAALEIREIKCIDKIIESAKISEVEPKKETKKASAKKKTAAKKKTTAKKTAAKDDKPKAEKTAKKAPAKKATAKKTTKAKDDKKKS